MGQNIDLESACKAACRYCKMGMPLMSNSMHSRPFGRFMDCGTDDRYPCKAANLRLLAEQQAAKVSSREI